jgi:ADP-heptose:LPS heptosyltransferase
MKSDRILFIAPTRIGDAVLASALLRHIEATHPQARVTIATSELSAPLYEAYPLLERLIRLQKKPYSGHWVDLLKQVIGIRWHAVWDMRGSASAFVLRTRHRHRFTGCDDPMPKVEQYAKQLHTGKLPYPGLWTNDAHRADAKAALPDGAKYLALAPTANFAGKEWPMEHYIALAKQLLSESGPCCDWRPVIISAAHERPRAIQLVEALSAHRPVDLTHGTLPLLSVYACMQRAHGFVGNDSGLMHMAAAAGIPTLGLFGITPAAIYGPYGLRTRAVVQPSKQLEHLSVQRVAEEFATLLQQ